MSTHRVNYLKLSLYHRTQTVLISLSTTITRHLSRFLTINVTEFRRVLIITVRMT